MAELTGPKDLTPDRIKELRRSLKLTQEALAKLLGVSTSTIIRWEKGDAEPSGTAAAVLLTLMAGPMARSLAMNDAMNLGPWIFSAYGIYKLLKDIFEPDSDPKK